MRKIFSIRSGILALAGFFLMAVPGAAQAPGGTLGALQDGLWHLRSIGGASSQPARNICLRNPGQLVQLRHPNARCTRNIISDDGGSVTVRYQCPGNAGWGRTAITVETPRLARVDTQGIDRGSPFHSVYEARRTGTCS